MSEKQLTQKFKTQKSENASDLARILCTLANAGTALRPISQGAEKGRLRSAAHFLHVMSLLDRAGWRPTLSLKQAATLYQRDVPEFERSVEEYAGNLPAGQKENAPAFLSVAFECGRLAAALDGLIDSGACYTENRSLLICDSSTGRMQPTDPRPLGPYHGILDRTLRHPRIDARRFDRCAACGGFFYKPRTKSRACGRKCEDRLTSREHYHREKEHRELALKLRAEGKSLFEIKRALGVTLVRARQYLVSRQEASR